MPPLSTLEIALRVGGAGLLGYLLGSLPSGVIVSGLFGKDPRTQGSGKTGATNVLRTLGLVPALLVALLDGSKGAVAILLTRYVLFAAGAVPHTGVDIQGYAETLAGLAALLGHNYSVFIGFKGGRGVMTGVGGLLVLSPVAAAIAFVCTIIPIAVTRYVSLGSIIGTAVSIVAAAALVPSGLTTFPHFIYVLLGGGFIIASHADNIERLLKGTERKLGQPAE
jgi:acyl phosphate:glycerol-3-phosphate acyltransferase